MSSGLEQKKNAIEEKKEDTLNRILSKHGPEIYKNSYTCYNGDDVQCGEGPACQERIQAFKVNNVVDPLPYKINVDWK